MHYSASVSSRVCKTGGFTLIETIVGIVVLAISFSVITRLIYPAVEQSADQVHQIRAAELGQSILNEIQSKAFDEKSDMAGGRNRCGENSIDCTANILLGSELSESRSTYDDVDDYDDIDHGQDIEDSLGISSVIDELYTGYSIDVMVCNDGNYDGVCDSTTDIAKLITVEVKTPTDFTITFSTYRANF